MGRKTVIGCMIQDENGDEDDLWIFFCKKDLECEELFGESRIVERKRVEDKL